MRRRSFGPTSTATWPPPRRTSPASTRRRRGTSSCGTPRRPDGHRTGLPGTAPGEAPVTVVVNRRADFTLDSFRRAAFGREAVEIGPAARDAMAAARRGFLALLDSDRTAFIYGITSRPGVEVATAVPPEQQREHAAALRAPRRPGRPGRGAAAAVPHGLGRGPRVRGGGGPGAGERQPLFHR